MTNPDNESDLQETGSAVGDETVPAEEPMDDESLLAADLAGQLNFGDALIQQLSGMDAERFAAESRDAASREKSGDGLAEHLEEIADDMLVLMRRAQAIEVSQQSVLARLDQLSDGWSQSARTIAREVDALRREVVGDRTHVAATGLFNELIPLIDNLHTMHSHLDEQEDARMLSQLAGVLETLSSCLRRLGCLAFEAEIGSSYDPSRMECAERLTDGEPGVVLESARPGYVVGEFVLRPVLVKIGASPIPENDKEGSSR